MELWQQRKTIMQTNQQVYQRMIWHILAVLILEALAIMLRDDLSTLIVFLIIDVIGAFIVLWTVKKRQWESKPGEQQSSRSPSQTEVMMPRISLENNASQAVAAGLYQDHQANPTRGDESKTRALPLQRDETKNDKGGTKALELLRRAGFTPTECDRLCVLRGRYMKQEADFPSAELRRLRFARWLVETGKLTDQL